MSTTPATRSSSVNGRLANTRMRPCASTPTTPTRDARTRWHRALAHDSSAMRSPVAHDQGQAGQAVSPPIRIDDPSRQRLVGDMIHAYAQWREECVAVQGATTCGAMRRRAPEHSRSGRTRRRSTERNAHRWSMRSSCTGSWTPWCPTTNLVGRRGDLAHHGHALGRHIDGFYVVLPLAAEQLRTES